MFANDKFTKIINLLYKNAWTIFRVSILIFLIPYIICSFFTHAYFDDLIMAHSAKTLGIWKTLLFYYNDWVGRYATVVASSVLNPLTYNWLFGMKMAPLALLALTIFAVYLFLRSVCGDSFPKLGLIFASLAGVSIFLYNAPEIFTVLYSFSFAIQYHLGNIFFLLFLTSFICLVNPGSSARVKFSARSAAVFLAVILPGMHEIFMILATAMIFIFIIASLIKKDPEYRFWILVLILSSICSYIAISAPGNFNRIGWYQPHGDFVFSVINSFFWIKTVVRQSLIHNPLLILFTIIFIPFSYKLAASNRFIRQYFNMNPFLSITMFIFIVAMTAFASYFATGADPLLRCFNSIVFVFIVGWFITIQFMMNRIVASSIKPDSFRIRGFVMSIIILLIAFMFIGKGLSLTSGLLRDGPSYYKDVERMYRIIKKAKADNVKDVVVPPIRTCPYMLWLDDPAHPDGRSDITPNPNHWINERYAQYFGFNSIRTEEKQQ